jgi:hypothetical protein
LRLGMTDFRKKCTTIEGCVFVGPAIDARQLAQPQNYAF